MSRLLQTIPVVTERSDPLQIPVCEISRRLGGRLQARIAGPLVDDWPLRLARGLAAARVNLLDALVRRVGPSSWLAILELEPAGAEIPDLLELATAPRLPPAGPEPPLLEVEIAEGADALEIEVHAWDSVGLLAAVLGRVERVGLVVTELLLETESGCAFHRLRIETPERDLPTGRQRRVLARQLALLQKGS